MLVFEHLPFGIIQAQILAFRLFEHPKNEEPVGDFTLQMILDSALDLTKRKIDGSNGLRLCGGLCSSPGVGGLR